MAQFKPAFDKTSAHEGGYVNDPIDPGGETYCGISRRFHPTWRGWALIDEAHVKTDAVLAKIPNLSDMVEAFYKDRYWDIYAADHISSQAIAEELYDTGINMGIQRSVRFLQTAINVLNRNQKNYPDIEVDGEFGRKTMLGLELAIKHAGPDLIYKILNVLQGSHYINIMRRKPSQERFARGWFNRVSIHK